MATVFSLHSLAKQEVLQEARPSAHKKPFSLAGKNLPTSIFTIEHLFKESESFPTCMDLILFSLETVYCDDIYRNVACNTEMALNYL